MRRRGSAEKKGLAPTGQEGTRSHPLRKERAKDGAPGAKDGAPGAKDGAPGSICALAQATLIRGEIQLLLSSFFVFLISVDQRKSVVNAIFRQSDVRQRH